MPKKVEASIEIETSFYSDLSRMNISVEEALKEFIDNSTSSFEDHRDELERVGESVCKVHIQWDDDEMIIVDNAYGMEQEEFERALRLSSRAEQYSDTSRGQYGIGLKNAAANIGRKYSIDSEQLKSGNRYYAEMDLDDLEVSKRKTVEMIITGSIPEVHRTKICISNLLQPFSAFNKMNRKADQLDKLLKRLGKMYSKDIRSNRLEIVINDRKVEYILPKMLKNKETDTEYIENVEGSFKLNGKIFEYDGWVGILNVADTAEAGLTLMQQDRAIQLNYRPQELFGRSNDFRYQRIVGEIVFRGSHWNVSFAKNRFQWEDNGVEMAFIEDIKKNKDVMKLFTIAKKYRKGSENVTSTQISKIGLDSTFDIDTKPEKVIVKTPSVKPSGNPEEQKENDDSIKTVISYNGEEFIFSIIPDQDGKMSDKWVSIMHPDKDKNEYEVRINARVSMFDSYIKKDEKELIVKMAVAVALAQITCKRLGLKEHQSQLFISQLNEILSNTKKDKK